MTLPENHPARLFTLEQVLEATKKLQGSQMNPIKGAMFEWDDLSDDDRNHHHVFIGDFDGDKASVLQYQDGGVCPDGWYEDYWYFPTNGFRPATESEIRAVFAGVEQDELKKV